MAGPQPVVATAPEERLIRGSIVICQGALSEKEANRFVVHELMSVPAESREESLRAMGIVDPFGTNERESKMWEIKEMEESAGQDIMVIVSDVTLTSNKVCENLKKLFSGFENLPQIASGQQNVLFAFVGPFRTSLLRAVERRQTRLLAILVARLMTVRCCGSRPNSYWCPVPPTLAQRMPGRVATSPSTW